MPSIQHIVLLKFKSEVTEETIADLFCQLEQLKDIILGIMHFSGGPYSSHEGLNQGYTHGFSMTFETAEARDVYLPHDEHERVKSQILPNIETVVAFDYER